MTDGDIWNHNPQYQSVLLRAVPAGCRRALDVGCGQGFLVRHLATRADEVIGIDRNTPSLEEAAERNAEHTNVRLIEGDVMTFDFDGPFDAVFSIGTSSVFPYIAEPVLAARMAGALTVEINPGESEVSHVVEEKLTARASDTLGALCRALEVT